MSSVQDRVRALSAEDQARNRPRSAAFDRAARAFSKDEQAGRRDLSAPPVASRAATFDRSESPDSDHLDRESSLKSRAAIFEQEAAREEEAPAHVLQQTSLFERHVSGGAHEERADGGLVKSAFRPQRFGDQIGSENVGERGVNVDGLKAGATDEASGRDGGMAGETPALEKSPRAPLTSALPPIKTALSVGNSSGSAVPDSSDTVSSESPVEDFDAPSSPSSNTQSASPTASNGNMTRGSHVGSVAAAASRFRGPASSLMAPSLGADPGMPAPAPIMPTSPSPPQSPLLQEAKHVRVGGFDLKIPPPLDFGRSEAAKYWSEKESVPNVSPMGKLSLKKAASSGAEETRSRGEDRVASPAFGKNLGSEDVVSAVKARSALFEQPKDSEFARAHSSPAEQTLKKRASIFEQPGPGSGGDEAGAENNREAAENSPAALRRSHNRWIAAAESTSSVTGARSGGAESDQGTAGAPSPAPASRSSVKDRSSAFENGSEQGVHSPGGRSDHSTNESAAESNGRIPPVFRGLGPPALQRRGSPAPESSSPGDSPTISGMGSMSSSIPATPGSVPSGESLNPSPLVTTAPVFGSPFQKRASMFEKKDEPEFSRLSSRPLRAKPDGENKSLEQSSSRQPPGGAPSHGLGCNPETKVQSESPPLRTLAARFEAPQSEVEAKNDEPGSHGSPSRFLSVAARFDQGGGGSGPVATKSASEPMSGPKSGFAARTAAFEASKEGGKQQNERPVQGQSAFAGRAAAFEKPAEKTIAEAKDRAAADKKSVFDTSFLDPLSPTKRDEGSAVFGTMSGHADARRVVVPKVAELSASTVDVGALVRMNTELVATLLQLKAACEKIEQSKDELKERIKALEAQTERSARR